MGQYRWDGLERKQQRQNCGGLDMYGGKDDVYMGIRMLRMELPGKMKRGNAYSGIYIKLEWDCRVDTRW